MMVLISIWGCCFLASIVQACCGSGYAMIVTALLPLFIPFSDAVVISCISSLFGNILLILKYRQYICFKVILLPTIICIGVTAWLVTVSTGISDTVMKRLYGTLLILIAVIFFFWGKYIHLNGSARTAIFVGGCVGFTNGLFAVGGPFMSFYLLSFLEDKEMFIGTIQAFFLICGLSGLFSRIASGMVTSSLLKLSAVSLLAICCGQPIGTQILRHLSFQSLKKVVYGFIAAMGIYLVFFTA